MNDCPIMEYDFGTLQVLGSIWDCYVFFGTQGTSSQIQSNQWEKNENPGSAAGKMYI